MEDIKDSETAARRKMFRSSNMTHRRPLYSTYSGRHSVAGSRNLLIPQWLGVLVDSSQDHPVVVKVAGGGESKFPHLLTNQRSLKWLSWGGVVDNSS